MWEISSGREKCSRLIVLLPVGSLEYHGGVMPLGTDTIIASQLAEHCAEELDNECITSAPPLPYGYSHEWLRYGSTISIEPETLLRLIDDVVSSILSDLDADKVLIINGHGGNTGILESVARKYRSMGEEVYLIDVWKHASMHGLRFCHACSFEAQLLEYLTGEKYSGVARKCRGEGYEACMEGSLDISVEEFVEEICRRIGEAASSGSA